MIEAVLSLVLVSGLLVVSLNTVGASTMGQSKVGDQGRAQLLALDLMNEILEQDYQDPTEPVTFGLEPLDIGPGRTGFDDVDDYRNYSASPPVHRDGTAISGLTGWTEQVAVVRVNATTPSVTQPAISETGVKKITVTIKKGTAMLATFTALRAQTNPVSSTGVPLNQW
ncbi:MAG: hypothetical protein HY287_00335 [Planctomycetes bacterium]|nr:hypothetical protein [Planctomycetota bacterium]